MRIQTLPVQKLLPVCLLLTGMPVVCPAAIPTITVTVSKGANGHSATQLTPCSPSADISVAVRSTDQCSGWWVTRWKLQSQNGGTIENWTCGTNGWTSPTTNNQCSLRTPSRIPSITSSSIIRFPVATPRSVTLYIDIWYQYQDTTYPYTVHPATYQRNVQFEIRDDEGCASCPGTVVIGGSSGNTGSSGGFGSDLEECNLNPYRQIYGAPSVPCVFPYRLTPGTGYPRIRTGDPYLDWALGAYSSSQDAGSIALNPDATSAAPWSPTALYAPFYRAGVEVLTNQTGEILQVKAPQTLANVAVVTPYKYQLQFFHSDNIAGVTNGLYGTNAPAFTTWTIENPDGASNTNRLFVTESKSGSADRQFSYVYTNDNGVTKQQMTDGASLQTVVAWEAQDPNDSSITNHFEETKSGNVTLQRRQTAYATFDGRMVLKRQVDGDGSVTNSTTYTYDNANRVSRIEHSDGNWEHFTYDEIGRPLAHYSAFANFGPPATADPPDWSYPCKVIEYSYDTVVPGDQAAYQTNLARLEKVSLPEPNGEYCWPREVSRLYRSVPLPDEVDEYRCADPGDSWWSPGTLVTKSVVYADSEDLVTFGKPKWELRPDGTVTIHTFLADANGVLTNTITQTGVPNDIVNPTNIISGTRVERYFNSLGKITNAVAKSVSDSTNCLVLSGFSYTYSGELDTDCTVVDLANRTNQFYSSCCGLGSSIDPDGVTTLYSYDFLKRQVAATTLRGGGTGITTTNILDPAGRVLETRRVGTNGTAMMQAQFQYDVLGRVTRETNALLGVTTHTNVIIDNRQCVTNIYPDAGTRTETYYREGRLESVSGTAAAPALHQYGVEQDGEGGPWREYSLEIKLTSTGGTNEWVKTYSDGIGRAYKTIYSSPNAPYPYSESFYNNAGQLWKQRDPDGVITFSTYNDQGEQEYTITAISDTARAITAYSNLLSSLDALKSGTDRITRTVTDVYTNGTLNCVTRRTSNYVWGTNGSATATLTASSETSADGLRSLQTTQTGTGRSFTNKTQTVYLPNGQRYLTNTAPDGSVSISAFSYNLPVSLVLRDGAGNQLSSTTYSRDAHGRQYAVTDALNGTTWFGFNNADQVTSVTTPAPSIFDSPQVTISEFDASLRLVRTVNPDNTSVTNEYFPTGQIKGTYGSRTYPVGYGYDAQGRLTKMTNWTAFPNSGERVTTWNYDAYRGWLANKVYAGGAPGPVYTNTPAGHLAYRAWARGTNTVYTYNNAGDLLSTTYNDGATPTLYFGYDRRGRQTAITNGTSICTLAYGLAGQLLSETWSGGTLAGLGVTNLYDHLLRRTNLTLNAQQSTLNSTAYAYDPASRLKTITSSTNAFGYSYIANSLLVSQIFFTNNGSLRMTTTKQYDLLNRLTSISSAAPGSSSFSSFAYVYNSANQRTRRTEADASYWRYEYDPLGQVKSGKKYWADGTPVAGRQFEYSFDEIGNRTQTKGGGDQNGWNLRSADYGANSLNQYTSRDVPGAVDITGIAFATNSVTVNGQSVYRKGEYFWKQVDAENTGAAVYPQISVASGTSNVVGNIFLPKTKETFTYDADGNLTSDGHWKYFWDAENRLVAMATNTAVGPQISLKFEYDFRSRRICKQVWPNATWNGSATNDLRFVYDGWNLLATLNSQLSPLNLFTWGLDLSGSEQGAGGVGALLSVWDSSALGLPSTHFISYDGNANVAASVNAATGATAANSEYGPFGEVVRATGQMAKANPFRFSTRYHDDESDMLYYGYRYYNAGTGRWLSRDPMGDPGFETLRRKRTPSFASSGNFYRFVSNNPLEGSDVFGLYEYEWEGNFTGAEKRAIKDSIQRVRNRANALIKQMDDNIKMLSTKCPCPAYDELIKNLKHLKKILQGIVKEVDDPGHNLEIYRKTGGDPIATYWDGGGTIFDDELTIDGAWFSRGTSNADEDMFHEITHGQGTNDQDPNDYNNAHSLDELMHTDKENWIFFKRDKKIADKKCIGPAK